MTNIEIDSSNRYHLPGHPEIPYNDSHLHERHTTPEHACFCEIAPNNGHSVASIDVVSSSGRVGGNVTLLCLSDLHIGAECNQEVLALILGEITRILTRNPNSILAIAGDTASRARGMPWLIECLWFYITLAERFPGRIYYVSGNHDPENLGYFMKFVDSLHRSGIRFLSNLRDGFERDPVRLARSLSQEQATDDEFRHLPARFSHQVDAFSTHHIVGNALLLAHGLTFSNSYGSLRVFTEAYGEAINAFDQDKYERDGRADVYGDEAGTGPDGESIVANIAVAETARHFKEGLEELASRYQDPDVPLVIVMISHEYYLRTMIFFEEITTRYPQFRIDPNILRRVHCVLACGHSHYSYSIEAPTYMTASDGQKMAIPCVALHLTRTYKMCKMHLFLRGGTLS
ncbi:MAG: metallophosphoesterase [Holosporales bacterium]|nr:metallophosphoesterase [Holosporales bacterium]